MFDWIGRTLLLILSGLATFAVLLSLQSASEVGGEWGSANAPVSRESGAPGSEGGGAGRQLNRQTPPSDEQVQTLPQAEPTQISGAAAPAPESDQWLRAITYALLALAGFAAAGLLVLLRITALLARIAER